MHGQRQESKSRKASGTHQPAFFFLAWGLKPPCAPYGHQGGAESSSEGQLDGCGAVAEVGAAAVPGDGVADCEQGSRFSLVAELGGQAASRLPADQSAAVEGC